MVRSLIDAQFYLYDTTLPGLTSHYPTIMAVKEKGCHNSPDGGIGGSAGKAAGPRPVK